MSDTAGRSALQHDADGLRHTLSLTEVEAELTAAHVARSHRHVQRLCLAGAFDAKRLPGPSGDEWFVAPHSVPKVIGDLRAMDERRARHGMTERAMSQDDAPNPRPESGTDAARHDAPQRAASGAQNREEGSATQPDTRYVALLERDNEFLREQVQKKDEQISNLSTRFSETQTLLGAMQRMFAPLLGQGDPFSGTKREVSDAGQT